MIFDDQFSRMERLLHRLAFRARFAQEMLADIEDALFSAALAGTEVGRPVFISGLPRSGTTILLYLLTGTGRFATHTYQDMPFILCPMLWNTFARRFVVDQRPRERAHGDGLQISSHSPEAFEEIIWKYFWASHYRDDRIEPWSGGDEDVEFNRFFKRHMAKIIAIRRRDTGCALRYLSKNNVNIARLRALPEPLRRGSFVVPFRDPVQHAASMLRQHDRFTRLHAENDFARRYMEAIGHHDFGLGLRPIDFGNWLDEAGSPNELEFWVRYWTAAYSHILERAGPETHLLSYDRLTANPEETLRGLAEAVGIPSRDLLTQSARVEAPRTHDVDSRDISRSVRHEAGDVFEALKAKAALRLER